MSAARQKIVEIDVQQHKTTGLLVAFSKQIPGLTVAARTVEEMEGRLPDAIREMLEADGEHVLSVELDDDAPSTSRFTSMHRVARAALAAS